MGNASIARALLAIGALACAGCHRADGSADSSAVPSPVEIGFSFELAGLWLNEGDAPASLGIVLSTSLPALTQAVSVEVIDLGTGTALAGVDHAGFPPQRVTFAAGSVDGAMEVVRLDPLDDDFVEVQGETVELGLRRANGGALTGTTRLTVTLIDADQARVSFVSAAGAAAEGGTGHVALELECGAGVTLQLDVTALVADLGIGTAVTTPVTGDYAAFPAETFLFPAGSADGAIRSTSLALLDDSDPEVDETIALGLSSPWPAAPGAIPVHVLTIEDDDLTGNATFLASEGARGIENPLVDNEIVDLGTEVLGGGPGAGTEVRVGNLGGLPMALAPPVLSGTQQNDFSIVVASSSFAVPSTLRPARAGPAVAEACAPLTALAGDPGPGVLFRLEAAELARMSQEANASLQGVVLPELGPVTLELVRRPLPLAPDARLVIDGQEVAGGPRTLLGDLELWSGSVAGQEGSRVFLALDREGLQGFVRTSGPSGGLVHVFADGPGQVRFVGDAELRSLGARLPDTFCAGERSRPGAAPLLALAGEPGGPSTSALTVTNCRLAIETDHQLFETLGTSSVELTEYVTSLIAAVAETFATDVQVTLSIAYLGIHTTADDGWDSQETEGASVLDLFYEFQEAWGAPGASWPAEADLAHLLSSARLGGGVAYLGVLCDPAYAFAVSSNLHGRIDWSAWTGQAATFTWDFVVVAHELGHNFGAMHTHSYCPPLDECAPPQYWEGCQDETRCQRGTLMSYCHLDCGDMSNIDLYFHPVTANYMRQEANFCLGPAALSPGDYVQYRVRFDPRVAPGPRGTTLLFTHDAPNVRRPFRVRLAGTAE